MRARAVMFAMGASLLMGLPVTGFAQDVAAPADDPGKAVFDANCTTCHDAGHVEGQHRGEEQWKSTIDAMIGFGAIMSDADIATVTAYLVKTHGPDAAAAPPAADATAAPPAQ